MCVHNLVIQECFNHGGSNSIQGSNRKFLGCTEWSTIELKICWKYVLYEYTEYTWIYSTLLISILSAPMCTRGKIQNNIWLKTTIFD